MCVPEEPIQTRVQPGTSPMLRLATTATTTTMLRRETTIRTRRRQIRRVPFLVHPTQVRIADRDNRCRSGLLTRNQSSSNGSRERPTIRIGMPLHNARQRRRDNDSSRLPTTQIGRCHVRTAVQLPDPTRAQLHNAKSLLRSGRCPSRRPSLQKRKKKNRKIKTKTTSSLKLKASRFIERPFLCNCTAPVAGKKLKISMSS